jgi:outer membrane lipoprotein-sorting protein
MAPSYRVRRAYPALGVVLMLLLMLRVPAAEDPGAWLTAWLGAQTNLQTWSAEVRQIRTLKSLVQPVTATGRVWFAAPNRFRWELGDPPQTIAVRQPEEMLVIYPRLRRAEKYALTGPQADPWREALALLEAGFPRSRSELESRFRILGSRLTRDALEFTLQPKSPQARRLMPSIQITVATNDFSLRATELELVDGSRLRNEFTNATLNPTLDNALFNPRLGSDLIVVEPGRAR